MKNKPEESINSNNRTIKIDKDYNEKLLKNCGFPPNFFDLVENFIPDNEMKKTEKTEINNLKKSNRLKENDIYFNISNKGDSNSTINEEINREKVLFTINKKNNIKKK